MKGITNGVIIVLKPHAESHEPKPPKHNEGWEHAAVQINVYNYTPAIDLLLSKAQSPAPIHRCQDIGCLDTYDLDSEAIAAARNYIVDNASKFFKRLVTEAQQIPE